MALLHDGETICGQLCQHPSCWSAERRRTRGISQTNVARMPPPLTTDDDLPTQSVINLLGDYGDDPHDRFPAGWGGRELHERSKSVRGYQRSFTSESYPKVRPPNATPASPARLSGSNESPNSNGKAPKLSKVEVQEVFELEDLQEEWQNTFLAKQYYVWVPKSKRPQRPRYRHGDSFRTRSPGQTDRGKVKDVTEDMVPSQIEWEREMSTLKKQQQRYKNQQIPPQNTPASFAQPRIENEGLYELLDLPRDVLLKVLEHMDRRDLSDRRKLAETLLRILPVLEKDSTAISLANSDVLQQHKIMLRNSREKTRKLPEPFQSRQQESPSVRSGEGDDSRLFFLDDGNLIDHMSTVNDPDSATDPDPDRIAEIGDLGSLDGSYDIIHGRLNKKRVLPAIKGYSRPVYQDTKSRVPSISLGLPELPSGVRITRPFNYSQQLFDFTLGRIPTPPSTITERPLTGAQSSRGSTIHVTVPSAQSAVSEHEDPLPSPTIPEKAQSLRIPEPPLHAISPTYSTNVPKTPTATPALRHGTGKSGNSSDKAVPSPAVLSREGSSPHLGINVIPEQAGPLGTIQEAETDAENHLNGSISGEGLCVPPQPPSTPTGSHVETEDRLTRTSSMVSPTRKLDKSRESTFMSVSREEDHDAVRGSPNSKPDRSSPKKSDPDKMSPPDAEKAKKLWRDESPAPPPPSPEPKSDTPRRTSGDDDQTTEQFQLAILEEAVESDGEMTLSACPPSNLDDMSRINTPGSSQQAPLMANQSVMRDNTIENFLSVSDRRYSQEERKNSQGSSSQLMAIKSEASDLSKKREPEVVIIPTGDVKPGEGESNPNTGRSLPADGAEVVTKQEHLVENPGQQQESSEQNPGQQQDTSVENPGQQQAASEEGPAHQGVRQELDTFDASEAEFREQLEQEYTKLSEDGAQEETA